MGQIAQALGQGPTLQYDGQTYTLAPWSYDIQARFERYLEAEATLAARRMAEHLPLEEAKQLLKDVHRDVTAGLYTFGTETVAEALKSLRHLQYLLWLTLLPNHPEVKLDTARKMMDEQLEQVMQAMSDANADPTKAKTATPESVPTPPSPA